jgi:hypothetical protein
VAQYEVKIKALNNASERLNSLANSIMKVHGQLDAVRAGLPSGFNATKQQISKTIESVSRSRSNTGKMGQTLQEITDIYKRAEQTAFDTIEKTDKQTQKQNTPLRLRPQPEKSQGVIFLNNLILPDWLQSAVLKYEQRR